MTPLCALFLAVLIAGGGSARPPQDAKAVERGKAVFTEQKCSLCHSVEGKGNPKGALDDVGTKLSGEQIRQWLLTPKEMPKHGILFADIHAGVTPLGDRVRIGGTMEFSGYDLAIDERRISNLYDLARGYVDLEKPDYEEPWAGLRPMTVDGLPILDWAQPYRNAYLATGYSMLGMTVSAPAGEAMAEMIVTGSRPDVFEPFRVDRFPRMIARRPGR